MPLKLIHNVVRDFVVSQENEPPKHLNTGDQKTNTNLDYHIKEKLNLRHLRQRKKF